MPDSLLRRCCVCGLGEPLTLYRQYAPGVWACGLHDKRRRAQHARLRAALEAAAGDEITDADLEGADEEP